MEKDVIKIGKILFDHQYQHLKEVRDILFNCDEKHSEEDLQKIIEEARNRLLKLISEMRDFERQ